MSRFTYKIALWMFFVSLIAYLIIILGVFVRTDALAGMSQGQQYFTMIFLELLLFVPLWIFIKVNGEKTRRIFRFRKVRKMHIFKLLLISFGLFLTLLSIEYIVHNLGYEIPKLDQNILLTNSGNLFLLFVLSAVVTPIVEEAVFRGFIFRVMLDRGYSPTMIIGVSSLLFSLAHLNSSAFLKIFAAGLILGFVAYYFHSIIPSIIIHSIFNILALVEINTPQIREWFMTYSTVFSVLLLGTGTLLLIAGILGIKNTVHIKRKRKE